MTLFRKALAATMLFVSTGAPAHVTISPKESTAGAREKLVVRVPNEKDSSTVAVELHFPPGLKITAVEQKPEWMTEALRGTDGSLTGVRWTGRLAPQQFVEFGLLAVLPAKAGTLAFLATQSFEDGSRIDWTGPDSSKMPAPRIIVGPPAR